MLVQLVKFACILKTQTRAHACTHTHTLYLGCSVTHDAGACRGAGALQVCKALFVLAPTVLRHLSETG